MIHICINMQRSAACEMVNLRLNVNLCIGMLSYL